MKHLIILYTIFLLIFCFGTTLLLLSSPHHVDKEFLILNTSSLVIFPITAFSLFKIYRNNKAKSFDITILLLAITAIIFGYYIQDFLKDINTSSGIKAIILFPICLLILTIIFAINIIKRRNVN